MMLTSSKVKVIMQNSCNSPRTPRNWICLKMCNLLNLLLLLLIVNLSLVKATYTNISEHSGNVGWIRLCTSGGGDNILGVVTADKCSSGYWFKDPVKIGCACGHGV